MGYIRLNHREEPPLVLHGNRKTQIRTQGIIGSGTEVSERAATREELLTDLLVAEVELQSIAWAKPVVRPSLRALPSASNPAPY